VIRGDPSDPPLEQCPFCGKKGHLSWPHAERVRKRRKRNGGKGLNIYLCRKSGLWHLGGKIDTRKRMRYDRREEKREMREEVKMEDCDGNIQVRGLWKPTGRVVFSGPYAAVQAGLWNILSRFGSLGDLGVEAEDSVFSDAILVLDCPPPNEVVGVEYAAFNQGEVA
jgi:hypothetical protein